MSTTQPPPSILKVKQPSERVSGEGVKGDGDGDGDGEDEVDKSMPATITRKIRFLSFVHVPIACEPVCYDVISP